MKSVPVTAPAKYADTMSRVQNRYEVVHADSLPSRHFRSRIQKRYCVYDRLNRTVVLSSDLKSDVIAKAQKCNGFEPIDGDEQTYGRQVMALHGFKMPPEHEFLDKENEEEWEDVVFLHAVKFTIYHKLRSEPTREFTDFAEAAIAAWSDPRALLYAVAPTGRYACLVRSRWEHYLALWKQRMNLK